MNNFDLKNYDFGSNNALMLEQRLRNAGVWPDNPMLATKLLRRQLRILRAGDLADMVAFGSIVNNGDAEKVRLRYWRDRAARLSQDRDFFDWPKRELSLDEIQERLVLSGIDSRVIEVDLERIMNQATARRDRNLAKVERRQRQYLKEQKYKQMLEVKYKLLLSRVEEEHGLKLEYSFLTYSPNMIRISWRPEVQDDMSMESYFFVYKDYVEEDSSTAFPSVVNAILQVASIGLSTIRALQKNGNHLSLSDNKLNVVSGRKRRFHRYLFLTHRFEKALPEAIVTEGEDVDLAVKLYEQVKAAGLSLCVC